MQYASATLAPVPLSNSSHCQVVATRNSDSSVSEVSPVNLASYTTRIHSGVDVLHYPSDVAPYSRYSQSSESPTKFNCPIDLAVSAAREQIQTSSSDPVDLAAYTRKQPDCSAPLDHSITDMSVRSSSNGDQPSESQQVLSVSSDINDSGISSHLAPLGTYQNASATMSTLATSSSAAKQDAAAYPHSLGLTHMPPAYHSAHWHTAQLVANAVSTSGQPLHTNSTLKEGECSPLLLQLQVCCGLF